jgi:ATP-dependent Clp endopeptidase proteolytic subunit ClpP
MRKADFHFTAKAGETPELFIYDDIGPDWLGMVSAKSVRAALDAIGDVPEIVVHVNSPGGDVFEGTAIYNILAQAKPSIRMRVDGLAASIASIILMAGDEIEIASNGMVMIHNAWTIAAGSASELRKTADVLEKIDINLNDTYVARTGLEAQAIKDMSDAETWMTADEAVSKGFADAKLPAVSAKATVRDGRYKHTPAAFLLSDTPEDVELSDVQPNDNGQVELARPPRLSASLAKLRSQAKRHLFQLAA